MQVGFPHLRPWLLVGERLKVVALSLAAALQWRLTIRRAANYLMDNLEEMFQVPRKRPIRGDRLIRGRFTLTSGSGDNLDMTSRFAGPAGFWSWDSRNWDGWHGESWPKPQR